MANGEFTIIDRSQPAPPQERLAEFIEGRQPQINLSKHPEFIQQWGAREQRATCHFAARLNGLIGIGAINKPEAEVAHQSFAVDQSLSWTLDASLGVYLPYTSQRTTAAIFNKRGILPVSVEFSDIVDINKLTPSELIQFIGSAALCNIATVLTRWDLRHDTVAVPSSRTDELLVVDSKFPVSSSTQNPAQITDYLRSSEQRVYIQMLYDVPLST